MTKPNEWIEALSSIHVLTLIVTVMICFSIYRGYQRGAYGSAKSFGRFLIEGGTTVIALYVGWILSSWLSGIVHDELVRMDITVPVEEMGTFQQLYYTFITSLRDFSLLRTGLIFLICYPLLKYWLYGLVVALTNMLRKVKSKASEKFKTNFKENQFWSGVVGSFVGLAFGAVRSVLLLTVLMIYVLLFPQGPFADYIQESKAYQKVAVQWIQPYAEPIFEERLPVFTRAVEDEFRNILERKYEIVDHHIPEDIAAAAQVITKDHETDEAKARALYEWVGTRVQYSWEKVRRYEEDNVWMEQTPEDTFASKQGVCIDYARLYAVMARSVDLEVKVVTGLGYDGRGGYGPHAWNEVYLAESAEWVPLDPTWVSSGRNWFNPADFEETHIEQM